MVGIIRYKMGNVTSVKNALEFLGARVLVVQRPKDLDKMSHIVLPGVGAFAEGMKNLRDGGFIEALHKNVIKGGKPFLGICLGMQLLATRGSEGGETAGLDYIAGGVDRLSDKGLRIPHIGWNTAKVLRANKLLHEDADFYFVHSFHFAPKNSEDIVASCDYGIDFVAAVGKDNIYGAQFHPEKSHQAGLSVLKNFLNLC